ncbi:MAG: competence/damage-inducible protein A [Sandaracinaceae bacterium]|nr:competence/damage-inducible protein A [Sandaracinaceae bacterium]
MTAAVFSIGTELTRGELVNTNACWLAEQLTAVGFDVVEHETVDDDQKRIVEALQRLSKSAKVVICTGGLGPTSDDLTTAAVADAMGVRLERDEASLEAIKRRFASFNREMSPSNAKQADFPKGAQVLPNTQGTAPGFAVNMNEARCFFMPGVPGEMKTMFSDHVLPTIAKLATRNSYQVHIRTFGLTESRVGEKLADLEAEEPSVTIGYRAHFPEIEVKVLARGETASKAETTARRIAETVRERLADAVYGGRDDSFAGSVGQLLRTRGLTLSLAESCTGGMIGSMLTDVPGSSDYVLFDAVTYSNGAKEAVLGVSGDTLRANGAVSIEVAAEMAEGALRVGASDIAVAVTGIAGPGGATEDKPVGTVCFAVARKGSPTLTHTRRLPGDRDRIRKLASYIALHFVARVAVGKELE